MALRDRGVKGRSCGAPKARGREGSTEARPRPRAAFKYPTWFGSTPFGADVPGPNFSGTLGTVGRISEQTCVESLRAAATALSADPLLHDDYERWRHEAEGNHPSSRTIVRQFGSWAEALEAAGLESARRPYVAHGPALGETSQGELAGPPRGEG